MPRLDLGRYYANADYSDRIQAAVIAGVAGGFCIFNGSRNQAAQAIADLRSLNGPINLLFSCDAEWGLSMRLSGEVTDFPHALALARSSYPDAVYRAAYAIGQEMRSIGIDCNFAPVADVNSDHENTIVNIRAFGDKPQVVALSAKIYAKGLHDAGVIATAKHFPGHGETKVDSHRALPILDLPQEHFDQIELPPFLELIDASIPAIMTGHLAAPAFARLLGAGTSEELLPATLSPFLTQKLLRERCNFKGVIITDSMEMAAVKNICADGATAAIMALDAGNDVVLMTSDFEAAHSAILNKAQQSPTFTEQILQSADRVRSLTAPYKQMRTLPPDRPANRDLALQIARKAIDISGDVSRIKSIKYIRVVSDDQRLQQAKYELLKSQLSILAPTLQFTDNNDDADALESAVFFLERPRGKLLDELAGDSDLSPVQQYWKDRAVFPSCIFLVGNPYIIENITVPKDICIVRTYSDSLPSIIALTELIASIK